MKKNLQLFLAFVLFCSLSVMGQNQQFNFIELEGHEVNAPKSECPDGSLVSAVPDGGWALTSSTNQGTINYLHFDSGMLDENTMVEGFVLWGLQAFHDGTGWAQCLSDEMDFHVSFYELGDEPGEEIYSAEVVASAVIDPSVVFGTWTVKKFTITLSEPVHFTEGFISLASTNAETCWFLGINSESAEPNSYIFDADGDFVPRMIGSEGEEPYHTTIAYCILGHLDDDENGDDPEIFTVTLNVDMTDAVAVGDVEFNPEIHDVWVTGTFAEWAMPGENADFQMHPADIAAKGQEVVYMQDFEGDDFPPAGWAKLSPDGGDGWDVVTVGTTPRPGWTGGVVEGSPAGGEKMAFCTWTTGGASANDQWLISPQITVAEDMELSFYMRYSIDSYDDNVDIRISTTVQDDTNAFDVIVEEFQFTAGSTTEWEEYTYLLTDHVDVGDEIFIAFREHVADNFNEGSFVKVDRFMITIPGEAPPPDSHIYTVTFDVEGGAHEYKYFLVEDVPTWDLGEKEGTDNREVHIIANVVFNNIWGDFELSIDPIVAAQEISLFPNPASSLINVEAGAKINEVRVFDITGRVVLQQEVGNETTTLDVTGLRNGLYIMQVNTVDGTESYRFHVVK